MNNRFKGIVVAVFLALTLGDIVVGQLPNGVTTAVAAAGQTAAQVGKKAPDFKLTDSNGTSHSLSQYKGKFLVLEWVNFECPFVKKHYGGGNMQKLQADYRKKGVVWLSINSSAAGRQGSYAPEKINQMIKERGATADAYLIDADGAVGRSYGATATPHMFVIGKDSKLLYAGAIDSINSADQEDIAKAQNYVASALDSALAGKKVKTSSTKAYGCSIKYQK